LVVGGAATQLYAPERHSDIELLKAAMQLKG
jgi:hypothetical protein